MSVHGSHCCKKHGCKYGDDDCPVVLGKEPQQFKQECCDFHHDHLIDSYSAVLHDMKERNIVILTIEEVENISKRTRKLL